MELPEAANEEEAMSIRDHQPDPVHWSLRYSYKREERIQPPPHRTTLEYLNQAIVETGCWNCDTEWLPIWMTFDEWMGI